MPPDDAVVVVRGGPIAAEKIVEHARRQAREFSYRNAPMYSISVSLTVDGWNLDALLAGPLSSRSTFAVSTAGTVRAAGFVLLPTYEAPHCDLLLTTGEYREADALLSLFVLLSRTRTSAEGGDRMGVSIEVDIPCDPTQIDHTGTPWTFLDEAARPERILQGAIVVTGDAEDPVFARVISLTQRPTGVKVHLEILPGDPLEYVEAMRRSHLLTA